VLKWCVKVGGWLKWLRRVDAEAATGDDRAKCEIREDGQEEWGVLLLSDKDAVIGRREEGGGRDREARRASSWGMRRCG
jgi:hypothetical protein